MNTPNKNKHLFRLVFLMTLFMYNASVQDLHAQQISDSLTVHFRSGYSSFDRGFNENGARLDEFIERIKSIQAASHLEISEVLFVASTSPEGSKKLNVNLAQKRASNLTSILRSQLVFADSLVHVRTNVGDWERLTLKVQNDPDVPGRDRALEILAMEDDSERKNALESLDGGKTWGYLLKTHFPDLRSFRVFISVGVENDELDENIIVEPAPEVEDIPAPVIDDEPVKVDTMAVPAVLPEEPVAEPEPVVVPAEPAAEPVIEEDEWFRRLTVKTNAPGLLLAIANAGVEIDIARHWSFTLPVYYSAWNYFKTTIKFRTFAFQPEFRYWISEKNDGFFAGAHFGLAYYNLAFDGAYRYQDHYRETPAVGGGLGLGYRLPISKNRHWCMEFTVGAGVYANHYDIFHNTPDTKKGLMIRSVKETYWGLDQAAISFSYSFDLKKKKGGER